MRKYWILALVWMFVIYYLSSSSNPGGVAERVDLLFSYTGHFFLFGVLAVFYFLSLKEFRVKKVYFYTLLLVIGYALFDEMHQLFVVGRSFEVIDIIVDSFAGLVVMGFE